MKHFSTGGEIPCIHLCSHICLSKGCQSKKYSLVSFVVLRSPFNYRLIDCNTTQQHVTDTSTENKTLHLCIPRIIEDYRKSCFIYRNRNTYSEIMLYSSGECPLGRGRYPIQQLLSASADTKVKMYTTLPTRGDVHQTSSKPSACILESVDAGIQGPLGEEVAL